MSCGDSSQTLKTRLYLVCVSVEINSRFVYLQVMYTDDITRRKDSVTIAECAHGSVFSSNRNASTDCVPAKKYTLAKNVKQEQIKELCCGAIRKSSPDCLEPLRINDQQVAQAFSFRCLGIMTATCQFYLEYGDCLNKGTRICPFVVIKTF